MERHRDVVDYPRKRPGRLLRPTPAALRRPRGARARGGSRSRRPRSAPSMRHDLGDQLVAVHPLDRRLAPGRAGSAWRSGSGALASDATCGRWVMQITWRSSPSARSRSPTARAVLPPIPASISSKTMVPAPRPGPRPVSASMIRESSPPDAASRSGDSGDPRVGRDQELDRLRSAGAETVGMRVERDLESGALHRERGELVRPPGARAASRPSARASAAPPRAPPAARRAAASRLSSSAASSSAFSSRSISARQRSAWASTASIVPPCFRFRRSSAVSRSSTCSSRSGSASIPSG